MRNFIEQYSCILQLATLEIHINEGRRDEKVRLKPENESLLVGLLARAEIKQSKGGFESTRESGAVGFGFQMKEKAMSASTESDRKSTRLNSSH